MESPTMPAARRALSLTFFVAQRKRWDLPKQGIPLHPSGCNCLVDRKIQRRGLGVM
jgi:hypothetical protein